MSCNKTIKLSDSQCKKLIEGLNKNTIHNKNFNRNSLYIVCSKTLCEYLKSNYPKRFNF